jgi:hypothetical protein
VRTSLPTRTMREQPDLDNLRRQAKVLLSAFLARDPVATAEITTHYHDADPSTFALHDAQLVLARAYGFESWPKLKAHVDGVTLKRLCDAVNRQDVAQARAMLKLRPELAKLSLPENGYTPLHYAVLSRSPEMVRDAFPAGSAPALSFGERGLLRCAQFEIHRRLDQLAAGVAPLSGRRRVHRRRRASGAVYMLARSTQPEGPRSGWGGGGEAVCRTDSSARRRPMNGEAMLAGGYAIFLIAVAGCLEAAARHRTAEASGCRWPDFATIQNVITGLARRSSGWSAPKQIMPGA